MSEIVNILLAVLYLLVFPGFLFLFFYGLFCEYFDRKLYARMQNRVGPPLFQPFADFVKLLAKEDIIPEKADKGMFSMVPLFAFAGVLTAILYIPIWRTDAVLSFEGDLVIVLFLLTIPSFALFFAGWHSTNLFSQIGAVRTVTQLFGYEIPFFFACLAPALIMGTWSISGILSQTVIRPEVLILLILAFIIAVISLHAKLERVPFDAPEAETEIAGGSLVEYTGRRLAIFRLMFNIKMVICAALITALFLGGPVLFPAVPGPEFIDYLLGFVAFLLKTLFVVFLLTMMRTVFARVRIDQLLKFCYGWLIPLSIVQFLLLILVRSMGWFA